MARRKATLAADTTAGTAPERRSGGKRIAATATAPPRGAGRKAWTEARLLREVRRAARQNGWADYHPAISMGSPAGFPDLVLVRPPVIIFAELKSERGRLSTSQRAWLERFEQCSIPGRIETYIWRPDDWPDILRILSGGDGDDRAG